jgi:hypothetical protein
MGKYSASFVSRVLRRFWNSLGGPSLQTGPLDDPEQLSPQVGIRVAVPRDDKLRPGFREFKELFQIGSQFWKKRNRTRLTTGVVLRLETPDSDLTPSRCTSGNERIIRI